MFFGIQVSSKELNDSIPDVCAFGDNLIKSFMSAGDLTIFVMASEAAVSVIKYRLKVIKSETEF